jgi:hypothetical protein
MFQIEVELIQTSAAAMRIRPVTPHGHAREADAECARWVVAHELVSGKRSLDRFARILCGSCAAHTYPTAPAPVVELGAHVIGWLFLFDDAYGEGKADREMRALMARFAAYETTLRTGRLPLDPTAFHHGLLDIRRQGLERGGAEWLSRFADSMARYFDGCVLELPHRRGNTQPSIEEYRKLRSWSIGTLPVFDLIELATGHVLPPEEAWLPALADLRERAALLCAWVNDVYSHAKEARDNDPLNLVSILSEQSGLTMPEAFGAAAEVFNADLGEFEIESAAILTSASPGLRAYVHGLADWVHGNAAWTSASRRY